MSESEWEVCSDPRAMLSFLRGYASARKLWLLSIEAYRRWWLSPNSWLAPASKDERKELEQDLALLEASVEAGKAVGSGESSGRRWVYLSLAEPLVAFADFQAAATVRAAFGGCGKAESVAAVAECVLRRAELSDSVSPTEEIVALIREIIGNPLHPAKLEKSWLQWANGAAHRVADAIYRERAFERMPILADALEDAGCTEPAILEHLRGPGTHARGCWLLDALLGKE